MSWLLMVIASIRRSFRPRVSSLQPAAHAAPGKLTCRHLVSSYAEKQIAPKRPRPWATKQPHAPRGRREHHRLLMAPGPLRRSMAAKHLTGPIGRVQLCRAAKRGVRGAGRAQKPRQRLVPSLPNLLRSGLSREAAGVKPLRHRSRSVSCAFCKSRARQAVATRDRLWHRAAGQ